MGSNLIKFVKEHGIAYETRPELNILDRILGKKIYAVMSNDNYEWIDNVTKDKNHNAMLLNRVRNNYEKITYYLMK